MNIHPKLLFSIVWWCTAFIINFTGNFPLNDDWSYAYSVKELLDHGHLKYHSWPAMTQTAHIVWGAIWCKVFGFSYTVLRLSTLFLVWISGLYFMDTLGKMRYLAPSSLFPILTWVFNPLFVVLSFSFMTDASFLSWSLIAISAILLYSKFGKIRDLILGLIFLIISVLTRQTGLFIGLWASIILLHTHILNKHSKPKLLQALLPILISLITLWLYTHFRFTKDNPALDNWGNALIELKKLWQGDWHENFNGRAGAILFYMGFAFLPLIPIMVNIFWNKSYITKWKIIGLFILLLIPIIYHEEIILKHIPFWNYFKNLGLGPNTLSGIDPIKQIIPSFLFTIFKWSGLIHALFIISIISIELIAKNDKQYSFIKPIYSASLSILILYIFYLANSAIIFDRYTLPFTFLGFIMLLFFIGSSVTKISKLIFASTLFLVAIQYYFSVLATHDYLHWNRSRWQALNYLTDSLDISPKNIDGGFEFNASKNTHRESENKSALSKNWWFVQDDEYVVSHSPLENYFILNRFPYASWMNFDRDTIYINKKNEIKHSDTLIVDMENTKSNGLYFTDQHHLTAFTGADKKDTLKTRSGRFACHLDTDHRSGLQFDLNTSYLFNEFEISFWVFGDPVRYNGLIGETALELTNKEIGTTSFSYNSADSSAWYFKNYTFRIPKSLSNKNLSMEIKLKSPGTVWVDDLKIIRRSY